MPNDISQRLGLSSFCYRYSSINPADFIKNANTMHFGRVLLCENLPYDTLSDSELVSLKDLAAKLDMLIDIGFNGLNRKKLYRHIEIAKLIDSKNIRIVLGTELVMDEIISLLQEVVDTCDIHNIKLAIENHFDYSTGEIADIVDAVNNRVGIIFDTTNALGLGMSTYKTLSTIGNRIVSMHLKDYVIEKVDAGYYITGALLGQGELSIGNISEMAMGYNDKTTVFVETNISIDKKPSETDVLDWENDCIMACRDYLYDLRSKYE